jgi:hypothetical protein
LAKESGLSHAELSSSARQTYGVLSLRDLTVEQATEMIDDLMPTGAKPMPEAPKVAKPLNYRFPKLPHVGAKPPEPRQTGGFGRDCSGTLKASQAGSGGAEAPERVQDQAAGVD